MWLIPNDIDRGDIVDIINGATTERSGLIDDQRAAFSVNARGRRVPQSIQCHYSFSVNRNHNSNGKYVDEQDNVGSGGGGDDDDEMNEVKEDGTGERKNPNIIHSL